MAATGIRTSSDSHEKTPVEVSSFVMDFSQFLGAGESLSSAGPAAVQSDGAGGSPLVVDSVQLLTSSISVTVSAGVDDGLYFVVVPVTTNLGNTWEGAVRVVVQNPTEG